MALGMDGGRVTKKRFIQHAMVAYNKQGNFLTKTRKLQGF